VLAGDVKPCSIQSSPVVSDGPIINSYCQCRMLVASTVDILVLYYCVLLFTVWKTAKWIFMIIRVLPRDAMQSTVLLRQVVRPSVCLSVTLRYHDHMDWKSLKIISRSLSFGCLLSADPNIKDLLQREHPEIFLPKVTHPVELSVADNGKLWMNG